MTQKKGRAAHAAPRQSTTTTVPNGPSLGNTMPTLFDDDQVASAVADDVQVDERTPQERFEQFHADNPHVYQALVELARRWISRTGRHRLGIGQLFEVLRWEMAMTTTEREPALNNSYRAAFARLIMANEPDLAGVFETRRSIADGWAAVASDAA